MGLPEALRVGLLSRPLCESSAAQSNPGLLEGGAVTLGPSSAQYNEPGHFGPPPQEYMHGKLEDEVDLGIGLGGAFCGLGGRGGAPRLLPAVPVDG